MVQAVAACRSTIVEADAAVHGIAAAVKHCTVL